MTHRMYITEPWVCSLCEGDKILGHGKTCPHCEGTGIEPVNEDPSDAVLDWANGRK